MTDYLKIYEKFKDVREVKDYIDDVILLRHYYATQQFGKMQEHIQKLMNKYFVETAVWNTVNHYQPITVQQSYINADNFLKMQGAILITKAVKNYAQCLSKEEIEFIKSLAGTRN